MTSLAYESQSTREPSTFPRPIDALKSCGRGVYSAIIGFEAWATAFGQSQEALELAKTRNELDPEIRDRLAQRAIFSH